MKDYTSPGNEDKIFSKGLLMPEKKVTWPPQRVLRFTDEDVFNLLSTLLQENQNKTITESFLKQYILNWKP